MISVAFKIANCMFTNINSEIILERYERNAASFIYIPNKFKYSTRFPQFAKNTDLHLEFYKSVVNL